MMENVQQNDGGKDSTNWWWTIRLQHNDGENLCSTKWWWEIRVNKMMVENYVQQNDCEKLGSTK